MKAKITELQELAGVDVTKPADTIQRVGRKVGWSETEQDEILSHFIKGGQTTALGVAQAVTSVAQTTDSPDRQDELEISALAAAELVAVA
jgi:ABC-type taurine transport system ATPase subunit